MPKVGDLEFEFSASGLDKIERKLDDLNDKLQRTAAITNALDGKDIDLDLNLDKDGSLSSALGAVQEIEDADPDLDGIDDAADDAKTLSSALQGADDALTTLTGRDRSDLFKPNTKRFLGEEREIPLAIDEQFLNAEIAGALRRREFEVNVDPDVDNLSALGLRGGSFETEVSRDVDTSASTRLGKALRESDLTENLSRLNDEAFALAGIFTKFGAVASGSIAAFSALAVGAGAAVGAVGGLAAAATALATKFGDAELRASITRLQTVFEDVARDFVASFQEAGVFSEQLFPAARKLAQSLRAQIPVLTRFTKENLPSLLNAVSGLADKINELVFVLDKSFRAFDTLVETAELVLAITPVESFRSIGRSLGLRDRQRAPRPSPQVGETESVTFGPNLDPLPAKATEKIRELKREAEAARKKFKDLDSFTQKDLQNSLVKTYEKAVTKLNALEAKTDQTFKATSRFEALLESALQKQKNLESRTPFGLSEGTLSNFNRVLSALNQARDRVGDLRQRFAAGIINEERFRKQVVNIRKSALKQLQQLKNQFPDLVPDDVLSDLIARIKQAQREVDKLFLESLPGERAEKVEPAGLEPTVPTGEAADRALFANVPRGPKPTDQEPGLLSLKSFNRELRKAIKNAETLGTRLAGAVTGLADGLSQAVGQSLGDALFADQRRLTSLRERRRSIQQNLRQAREQGNFDQVRQLRKELNRVNSKLQKSQSLIGRLGKAFQNFGQLAKRALETFVSQLITAITKLLAFKALSAIFGVATGGVGTVIGTGVTAGLDVASAATGGFVKEGGLAKIHKGETIVPAGTGMAATNINVNVTGQSRIEGRDIVMTYDTGKRIQRRKGHSTR